ncbi:MAG: hypothetical protein AB8H80_22915 [Planctomycetota bacterium]
MIAATFLLSVSAALAQQTLIVPTSYATISAAVAAAAPGDTVLCLAGTYSLRTTIDKGIRLVGQGAVVVGGVLSSLRVVDVPLGQTFVLDGFTVGAAGGDARSIPLPPVPGGGLLAIQSVVFRNMQVGLSPPTIVVAP